MKIAAPKLQLALWALLIYASSLSLASAEEILVARAIVKANSEATISVFLSARVGSLPFRAGQSFNKGDVLVSFECERYKADLRAKKSVYTARKLQADNNRRLLRRQAIGANETAISIAQMDEAEALVAVQKALIGQCTVKAPYPGRVIELFINENETPGANQPLIKIVDTTRYELELIIPSRWLVWIKVGTEFSFLVDETGEKLNAKVSRLGAVVDAVSQTIKITGQFSSSQLIVLPGMSGNASFPHSGG